MRHNILFSLCFAAGVAGAANDVDPRGAPPAQALAFIGVKYQRGGDSPNTGFDCSGFVAYVFQRAWGLLLPRDALAQSRAGERVPFAQLEPGDLVFYNTRNRPFSHVGIYLGEGNFVHAPKPGRRVRVESVTSPYWRARFNGARRLEPPPS